MSDERVNVSKEPLDNIAKQLMQATETTDNLSLSEMATAAQMMLPAKWELVVDTTLEQEVSYVTFTIPNAEEVVIFAQNANGLGSQSVTTSYPHYMCLWGQIFLVGTLTNAQKTTIIHGIRIADYALAEWSLMNTAMSIYNTTARSGCFIPQKVKNNSFGINVQGKGLWAIGTELKIWVKRRVNANA